MKANTAIKCKCFIVVTIVLASVIGIYGQGITYYIVDNIVGRDVLSLLGCLTTLTILSICLFLIPALLIWIGIKKSQLSKRVFSKYLITDVVIGAFISIWSILVLIAWHG